MFTVICKDLREIPVLAWEGLDYGNIPFLRHQFLAALERTGCVGGNSGWLPEHLLLYDGPGENNLLGAVPMYRKHHSYGEYVFDWSWAAAYEQAGQDYYPKLVVATPFTPVTGPRLLIQKGADDGSTLRRTLVNEVIAHARDNEVSSVHWLFTNPTDDAVLEGAGLLARTGTQFHWHNHDYHDFSHYLQAMSASKRKKINRERRRVSESGLRIDVLEGPAITAEHLQKMYGFYLSTIHNHGGAAYLNAAFFREVAAGMADSMVLMLAYDAGHCVAGSFNLRSDDAMFGRYWGSAHYYNALHFELCYYRPIEYCIENRIKRFEAGAQGEHKLSRGLLPVATRSRHWLKDPLFARAVTDFLHRETYHVQGYAQVLQSHSPFRDQK